jgi:hypothetical protein
MIQTDLDKIVAHWGGQVPHGYRNTYLHLVATSLTHTDEHYAIERQISRIATVATPNLSEREIAGIVMSAMRQGQAPRSSVPALDGRLHYSGAKIAELLDISDCVAQALGLEQVFSEEERSRRKAAKEKMRRQEAGAVDRDKWLARNSATREKPWKLAGLSRTKWYELGLHRQDQAP